MDAEQITTLARKITARDNTTELTDATIESLVLDGIKEIARLTMCLTANTSGIVASETLNKPTDMVDSQFAIDSISIDDVEIKRLTFREYKDGLKNGFAYRDGVIYLSPYITGSYVLYYRREHPDSLAEILLPDKYKNAVAYYVCRQIFELYGQTDRTTEYYTKYRNELNVNDSVIPIVVNIRG